MTTLSSVLGLIPLAIGIGAGAEVRAPLAITLLGGLVVAPVLTLVVIPVVYAVVDRGETLAPAA
jgi:HAE1 family hydrophobic/amphiphilic exporter-1